MNRRRLLAVLTAGISNSINRALAQARLPDSRSSSQNGSPGAWFQSHSAPWVDKLSKPQYGIKFHYQVDIAMRHGVQLRPHISRPAAEGRLPVLSVSTPY